MKNNKVSPESLAAGISDRSENYSRLKKLFILVLILPVLWRLGVKDFNTPSNVDCLYNTAELQFDYLEYDDTFQFGRKCIKILSVIGDGNAIDKLKLLSTSKIAEYAKKELRYKGLL